MRNSHIHFTIFGFWQWDTANKRWQHIKNEVCSCYENWRPWCNLGDNRLITVWTVEHGIRIDDFNFKQDNPAIQIRRPEKNQRFIGFEFITDYEQLIRDACYEVDILLFGRMPNEDMECSVDVTGMMRINGKTIKRGRP